jgi:hypothetical protein
MQHSQVRWVAIQRVELGFKEFVSVREVVETRLRDEHTETKAGVYMIEVTSLSATTGEFDCLAKSPSLRKQTYLELKDSKNHHRG